MTYAETEPVQTILPDAPDTFCTYLARQLIAKEGYTRYAVAEGAPLAENCDILLSHSDGYTLRLLCLIDREAHPERSFGLTPDAVDDVGKACLPHTGRIYFNKMPVAIMVMEIGPEAPDARQRLAAYRAASIFSKVQPSGWIVDPGTKTVWNNAGLFGRWAPPAGFIRKLFTSPYEPVVIPQARPVAHIDPSFPYLTTAIIALLCVIFAGEVLFGIGPWTGFLEPSIATLLAFGGIYRPLVMQGEWFRLLSGPLLHADLMHLALNCVALFIAGRLLEGLVGRAWLAACFVIGAISGALFSLAFNPETLISVGASGAVMGLFATLLILAFRFPKGPDRTALLLNSVYVLVASLAPVSTSGGKIDVAAHMGGAVGGLIMGGIIFAVWRRDDLRPRFSGIAAAVGLVGLAAAAYAFTPLPQNYRSGMMIASLIPDDQAPKNGAEWRAQSKDLIAKFPRDPRPRYFHAIALFEAKQVAAAEQELRTGLADVDIWRKLINPEFAQHMQVALAVTVAAGGRQAEGREAAAPVCGWAKGSTRAWLDEHKLCEK